jgi:putative restriction endonuclease
VGRTLRLFVGVTDFDWYRFLSSRANVDEVNFWQPGGSTVFQALQPGELFLFKLHSPRNFIVGGGVFAHASLLPVSLAWDSFGENNGARSLDEMRSRVAKYRRETIDPRSDYQIGCRLLEQPFFFPEPAWIPVPESWSPNIVVGKGFDANDGEGLELWAAVQQRLEFTQAMKSPDSGSDGSKFGPPVLIEPRLGQGSFRIKVTDAYERRCAITGERTLPILDAAHIRPYGADGGSHRVQNGLLLRTDIHRLFDRGYVTISEDHRFEVGRRLKDEFENGHDYYALHGCNVRPPSTTSAIPDQDALEWHRNERFLG